MIIIITIIITLHLIIIKPSIIINPLVKINLTRRGGVNFFKPWPQLLFLFLQSTNLLLIKETRKLLNNLLEQILPCYLFHTI